ncbi:hypothetical protein F4778DRAFT_91360 [Xylariomycetidae sp. FL2044]|nr:hypothetical protein F4778DRAFT_91360 [Xylariomycetidae sp. FL2044]
MDPLSITMACVTLIGVGWKGGKVVTSFLRKRRSLEPDLDGIIQEFESIIFMAELLEQDFIKTIPPPLDTILSGLIHESTSIMRDIINLMKETNWSSSETVELKQLRGELRANGAALGLIIDAMKLTVLNNVHADMYIIQHTQQRILHEAEQIKQRHLAPHKTDPINVTLWRHLDKISCYAESIMKADPTNTNKLGKRFGLPQPLRSPHQFSVPPWADPKPLACPIPRITNPRATSDSVLPENTHGSRPFSGTFRKRTLTTGALDISSIVSKTRGVDLNRDDSDNESDSTHSLSGMSSDESELIFGKKSGASRGRLFGRVFKRFKRDAAGHTAWPGSSASTFSETSSMESRNSSGFWNYEHSKGLGRSKKLKKGLFGGLLGRSGGTYKYDRGSSENIEWSTSGSNTSTSSLGSDVSRERNSSYGLPLRRRDILSGLKDKAIQRLGITTFNASQTTFTSFASTNSSTSSLDSRTAL